MLAGLIRRPWVIIGATILTLISSLLTVLPMVVVGSAVDELSSSNAITARFVQLCWLIVGLGVAYLVLFFMVGYAWAVVTLGWERDARQQFIEALQNHSMAFHDEVDSKRMLSVAMQDITWVRFSLNPALRFFISAIASFVLTGIVLANVDTSLSVFYFGGYPIYGFTLIILVGIPLYIIFAYRYANRIAPVRKAKSEKMEELTSISQGVFQGIEVVRTFNGEEGENAKFGEATKDYESISTREGRLAAFYTPLLILTGMTITALLYGSYALLLHQMTEGTLIEVLGLLVSLEGISFMLPQNLLMIRGGYVNAQRIVNILGWRDPLNEPENEEPHVDWNGDIVFENVSFAYGRGMAQGESYALRNLNVTIPSGSRVALIGSPGSGKSTVLKLLLRFYDPAEGRITVGGVDLKNVGTKTVRSHVGMVEQDVFLFMASVKDNIAFGRTDATIEEIQDAARRAQAEEFILQMPEGYDTVIGERGMTLSGGQRQRLAIARAIIHNPEILLLDDSVSAVDARTEYMMRKALNEVMTGRTSITVTQRLRTLVESDLILILDKGTLIGAGTHAQLLKSSEHYRRIFERLPGATAMIKPARAQRGGK
ncbi:MAG: hypothetical protein C4K47_07235 [Candidatus Thorarchaeota archaeon]|nr:MAG: hypothetical protein C4K47_07235 [Candidatus Thorarchaeota archaeon]